MDEKLVEARITQRVSSVAGTTRRAAKLSAAALISAVVMAAAAGPAEAQPVLLGTVTVNQVDSQAPVDPSIADSDGVVPVYEVCIPEDPLLGDIGGGYLPLSPDGGFTVEGVIFLNACGLQKLGSGPNDIQRVLAHELGHAAGFLHTDDTSDLMFPFYPPTGS